jgi:hypothetical protein
MAVNNVNPEINYIIMEMRISAYMYCQNYMADSHVILETCFTEMLLVCNFGITWSSTM